MRAPSAAAASFTQTISSATYSRPANVPKATIRSGDHPLTVADHGHRFLEPPGDKFRMLDEIRCGIENAGHQQHMRGQRVVAQCIVFMLVPGIGELDRKCSDIGTVQLRQDGCHRDVVDMRPVIVAPADMQPDAVAGNALDAQIDRRDMQFELAEEFGVSQIVEKPMPLHRQIRSVNLQDQAGVVDGAIFVGQRFRQGHQIGLVAVVMLIEHGRGNDAR